MPERVGNRHFCIDEHWYEPNEIAGPFFHNTSVKNLVQASVNAPGSSGILKPRLRHVEGRSAVLCYSVGTHDGLPRVKFYTDGGIEKFESYPMFSVDPDIAWCSLEVMVSCASMLGDECGHEYCINKVNSGDANECPFVGICAILVPAFHLPAFCLV
jgi:hypothetical protein